MRRTRTLHACGRRRPDRRETAGQELFGIVRVTRPAAVRAAVSRREPDAVRYGCVAKGRGGVKFLEKRA
ncbi:hypothetical protein GCM10018793_23800 [Streptomyces sulfonofaciens]|uniref:Uncharacterized protein n=1 Tax=Streptomyces sulfonofaciens TaxID=68272 RepID=A0A919KYK3_9ACTN|nr:hypothetical protein GCM10018793_23800 [Streptomyces sulfonofaciens]